MCLEPSYFWQVLDIGSQLYRLIFGLEEKDDDLPAGEKATIKRALQDCSSKQFMKLKYAKHEDKSKLYVNNYARGVITD